MKNALQMAQEFFEQGQWSQAYEICKGFDDDDTELEGVFDLEIEEILELEKIKIRCLTRALFSGKSFDQYDEDYKVIWNEDFKWIVDEIETAIISLPGWVRGIEDEDNLEKAIQKQYAIVFENLYEDFLTFDEIAISNLKNADNDDESNLFSSYVGISDVIRSTIVLMSQVEEMDCYPGENVDIVLRKREDMFFEKYQEVSHQIIAETTDFPYYDNKEIAYKYFFANYCLDIANPYKLKGKIDESVRIFRLKSHINLKCDLLNAIVIIDGKEIPVLTSQKQRENNYNDIIRFTEAIKEVEPDYTHPDVSVQTSAASNGGGCYVATAVYGSYDCPQVWTLRRYRDYTLAKTWHGRMFIKTYYAISPTIVKWFGSTTWFKKMWQDKLDRIVKRLQEDGVASTPYADIDW